MRRFISLCLLLILGAICAIAAGAPADAHDTAAWNTQLNQIHQQLELLRLFAAATTMGGLNVPIPRSSQHIPLENSPGAQEAVKAGLQLSIKEVHIQNLAFEYQPEPLWMEERPAVPALMRFSKLRITVDAKTPLGLFVVKCTFRNGVMPVNFECMPDGYTVHVVPDARKGDARLDDANIDLGGPGGGRALSKIFGRQLSEIVLKAAMGQTFKLDRGGLLGGAGGLGKGAPDLLNRLLK